MNLLQSWARRGYRLLGPMPLLAAAKHGRLDVARCIVNELGADVNHQDSKESTASYFAAALGNLDVMRCLVREFGVDINRANHIGNTALMVAGKHAALTKWMVKAGADTQAMNSNHQTAADVSRAVGASPEQTAYLEAKAHCAQPGCNGAGTKKCQGCMQGRYCGRACHRAHWPAHRAECRRLGAELKSAQEKESGG
jgi:hypothetical protein